MGHAQTGSGKTAAFMLPVVSNIKLQKDRDFTGRPGLAEPYVVIISPTKVSIK
jgi:superfamily II DNA/RNA helicase